MPLFKKYVPGLNPKEKADLQKRLHDCQNGKCFLCDDPIDLELQHGDLDIDHVIPIAKNGKDQESNFALMHSHCNKSKGPSDLRVARLLMYFNKLEEKVKQQDGRGANLGHLLGEFGGAKKTLKLKEYDDRVEMSITSGNAPKLVTCPVYKDTLSGMRTFFVKLPLEYLHHDDRINPRSIGSNIRGLIEEFQDGKPQLHVSLAWWGPENNQNEAPVKVFDGQHKAAAQILLSVKELPVRVFLRPNTNILLEANTNAGDKLRQVAFDTAVKRHLGNTLYHERCQDYQKHKNLSEENFSFSEDDLVKHFLGESRQVMRYIIDAARDSITRDNDNRLMDFVELAGKEAKRPMSYATIEKTFYSLFLYPKALKIPIHQGMEQGTNPRQIEKQNMVRLMSLFADIFLVNQWDTEVGGTKIESRVLKGEKVPINQLRAWRICREEVLYNILKYVRSAIQHQFILKVLDIEQLMQEVFPDDLWTILENVFVNVHDLPCWVDYYLANTVFGAKQNHEFWDMIFKTGKTPTSIQVLPSGLDLAKLMQSKA